MGIHEFSVLFNQWNQLGSIYAIMRLDIPMVYGIARMLNFAHGVSHGWWLRRVYHCQHPGVSPWLGLLVAVGYLYGAGYCDREGCLLPLRGASSLAVLITAIWCQLSAAERSAFDLWFPMPSFTSIINLPNLMLADGRCWTISAVTIVTIITCIVIMVGLTAFINKTKIGQAMLAVSEDTGAAT